MTSLGNKLASVPVERLSTWAIAGGLCGLLAAIGPLPPAVKAALLLAFVAAGPGSALLQYGAGAVSPIAQRALVPVLGFAIVILVVTVGLLLGAWAPRVMLVTLAVITVALGIGDVVRQRGTR